MQMTVLGAREPHVADASVVAIEPYHLQVTAKRTHTLLDRLAERFVQRKPS